MIATGGGKTRTAAEMIRTAVARAGRVAFLAPSLELVAQAARALRAEGLRVGIISATDEDGADPEAPVQVCSIGTILSRGFGAFVPTIIVFDEAHLSVGPEYSTLLTRWPGVLRLGLTATPVEGMGALFDAIIAPATIRRLMAERLLAPLDIVAPAKTLRTGELSMSPLDAWLARAAGRRAVVFAPGVPAGEAFAAEFRAAGVTSEMIHGDLDITVRRERLAAYEAGELTVLVNCGVLTTGWDSPRSKVAILARRCGSIVLYLQITGRILRAIEPEERALLLDLTGAVHIHGRPDDDRVYSLDGRAIRAANDVVQGSFCSVCGALFEVGAATCVECGTERDTTAAPKVVGAPMKLLASDFCAKDPPWIVVQRLRRWTIEAESKNRKVRSALHKFAGVYRRPATHEELRASGWLAAAEREAAKGAA